jgi:hypothetical protein
MWHFGSSDFLAVLKWKQGERAALSTAANLPVVAHVLFEMPPAGDFDHEKGRPLSPTEHIKVFGTRLKECWGRRPAFIDAKLIDNDVHKIGFDRHPLTELLERGRVAGSLPLPATSLHHSAEYQSAVRRFTHFHPHLPLSIRIKPEDLDSRDLKSGLSELLDKAGTSAERVFVVMDLASLEGLSATDIDEFAESLVDRMNEFPFLHDWLGFALVLSSFPSSIKLRPGEFKEYARVDLPVYKALLDRRGDLLRLPMYGDYALDTSPPSKGGPIIPSAHLRYSTPETYAVSKGTSVRKPLGYEAIYAVADTLVGQPAYMGRDYSLGGKFIHDLHLRASGPGNASKWRWAATDHHLTVNARQLCLLHGVPQEPAQTPIPVQEELFQF